jgi:hypothetical protein
MNNQAQQLEAFTAGLYQLITSDQTTYSTTAKALLEGNMDNLQKPIRTGKNKKPGLMPEHLAEINPQAISKTFKKIKPTFWEEAKAISTFSAYQDVRFYLNSVNVDQTNNRLIASNGHQLAIIENYSSDNAPDKGGIIAIEAIKRGAITQYDYIEARYPDFTKVLNYQFQSTTINLSSLADKLRGIKKASAYIDFKISALELKLDNLSAAFDIDYLLQCTDLLQKFGYSEVNASLSDNETCLLLTSPDNRLKCFVMALHKNTYYPVFNPIELKNQISTPAQTSKAKPSEQPDKTAMPIRTQTVINTAIDELKALIDNGTIIVNKTTTAPENQEPIRIQDKPNTIANKVCFLTNTLKNWYEQRMTLREIFNEMLKFQTGDDVLIIFYEFIKSQKNNKLLMDEFNREGQFITSIATQSDAIQTTPEPLHPIRIQPNAMQAPPEPLHPIRIQPNAMQAPPEPLHPIRIQPNAMQAPPEPLHPIRIRPNATQAPPEPLHPIRIRPNAMQAPPKPLHPIRILTSNTAIKTTTEPIKQAA